MRQENIVYISSFMVTAVTNTFVHSAYIEIVDEDKGGMIELNGIGEIKEMRDLLNETLAKMGVKDE